MATTQTEIERQIADGIRGRGPVPILEALGLPDVTHKTTWSVGDLLTADFPEPRWVVPGLLPAGLAILAGRPKIGKSWLALQLAIAVGSGGRFMGEPLECGPVLYLALEDRPRRLKSRLELMGAPGNALIRFETTWLPLDGDGDAGLVDLQRSIQTMQPRLIVIDTLARSFSDVDWNDLQRATGALGELQSMALDADLCLLCIDHHRKGTGVLADVIDDVLGSTGKAAVADLHWGLYRIRGERGATLRVTGRDLDDRELAIEFDGLTYCWQLLGDARQVAANEAEQDILEALEALHGEADAGRIADYMDKSRQAVARVASRMEAQGKLRSRTQGRCRILTVAHTTRETQIERENTESEDLQQGACVARVAPVAG